MARLLSIAVVCIYLLSGAQVYGEIPLGGSVGDHVISMIYDPRDGNFSIDAAGQRWTTLEIVSQDANFTGPDHGCSWPGGPVVLCDIGPTPTKFFALDPAGRGDTDFGRQLAPMLAADYLSRDLSVAGSLLPSGPLGVVDLIVVPEPSGLQLVVIAIAFGAVASVIGRRLLGRELVG